MAGIQSCFRKFLTLNSSRLINKNGILLQPSRERHYLVFHISSPQCRVICQTKKFCNTNKQILFRLASTTVTTPKEGASDVPKLEVRTEAVQVHDGPKNIESTNTNTDENSLPPAPEPELSEVPDMEFILTGLKEPTFESLGLGSLWPPGIIQHIYEYLHTNLELPWWQAIVVVTILIRLLLTPVVIKSRRDGAEMMNHLPEITKFQQKINEAKMAGDYYGVANHTANFQKYITEKKVNMFSFARTALIQGPIFLSMYYALNGMAKAPVESLRAEGLFWFKDLTIADPYYILPITLSTTLLAVIEVGAEANPAKANTHTVKWVLRAMPLIALLFSANCSACITWYWTVSNSVTLLQAGLFKIPAVKKALKIPEVKTQSELHRPKKGFIEGFKEGFENAKITHQVKDMERMNLMSFQKAGTEPIPRTFKKNPLLTKGK